MKIDRVWAMPNKWTFKIKPIRELLEKEMGKGKWIDPFAGKSNIADITNDLNPDIRTDYTMKAVEFLKKFDNRSIDGVIYDPPYSGEQIKRSYDKIGYKPDYNYTKNDFWAKHRDEIARILKIGGKAISFGWNSTGIGKTRGFKKKRILLICHGSAHNDTICVVERKKSHDETLDSFTNKDD